MRILIAFDKFKGALTASEACRIAADAILDAPDPATRVDEAPLTDGGEGFCETLVSAGGGRFENVEVSDPLGRPIQAPLGWVEAEKLPSLLSERFKLPGNGTIAVVEMAAASGLLLLKAEERDPWKTGSQGTGELIKAATEKGADAVVLGIGGSATNDAGCGALEALGARFFSKEGGEIRRVVPMRFGDIAEISFAEVEDPPPIIVACDVDSPLLGPNGATALFGPQKGLRDLAAMEKALGRIARMQRSASGNAMDPGTPGAGAAGGIACGISAVARLSIQPGFELVSAWLGLREKCESADYVLTGEGRLDEGSLGGKGPVALIRLCSTLGVEKAVFAGAVDERAVLRLERELGRMKIVRLSDPAWSLGEALNRTGPRLGEEVRNWFEGIK